MVDSGGLTSSVRGGSGPPLPAATAEDSLLLLGDFMGVASRAFPPWEPSRTGPAPHDAHGRAGWTQRTSADGRAKVRTGFKPQR